MPTALCHRPAGREEVRRETAGAPLHPHATAERPPIDCCAPAWNVVHGLGRGTAALSPHGGMDYEWRESTWLSHHRRERSRRLARALVARARARARAGRQQVDDVS